MTGDLTAGCPSVNYVNLIWPAPFPGRDVACVSRTLFGVYKQRVNNASPACFPSSLSRPDLTSKTRIMVGEQNVCMIIVVS